MYFHLFEIAIYLWLKSIRDTKEFQFAFVVKLCEIIFLRQLTMEEKCWFSLCLKNCSKRSLFLNRYLVSSRNALSLSDEEWRALCEHRVSHVNHPSQNNTSCMICMSVFLFLAGRISIKFQLSNDYFLNKKMYLRPLVTYENWVNPY